MSESFLARLEATLVARPPQRFTLEESRDAAVLIPVVGGERPTLIFTLRTDTLPSHKGQISFPGGSIDPDDEHPEATALREAEEELGMDPAAVRVLGELDSVPTFVSGYVVHPVVGWLEERPPLRPNPAEVAEILEVPIADLTDDIHAGPGFTRAGRSYPTEAWIWREHIIWGVTARIVRLFLDRLADAGLTARPSHGSSSGHVAPAP